MEISDRPWGKYEVLVDDDDHKVKTITVNPSQRLSYQSHERRSEHWVVVRGSGLVTLGNQHHRATPGKVFHIPAGTKHRVSADGPGFGPLVFIEVQTGDYFGEDDIVRYEDDYNRTSQT